MGFLFRSASAISFFGSSNFDHDQNNENMRKIKGVTLLKMIKNDRFLKKMTKFSKKLADCACDFEKKMKFFKKVFDFFQHI